MFLEKVGLKGRMPTISACGGRQSPYEDYRTALRQGQDAVLLIDSEAPVLQQHHQGDPTTWKPWAHLAQRHGDGWQMPRGSADADCHRMVQCMETWFLADRAALVAFFGQGYREKALPAEANPVEGIAKTAVYDALSDATSDCKTKARYGKGDHSFKLRAQINPHPVTDALPWARRFVDELKRKIPV